jgi:hypothetical protein
MLLSTEETSVIDICPNNEIGNNNRGNNTLLISSILPLCVYVTYLSLTSKLYIQSLKLINQLFFNLF